MKFGVCAILKNENLYLREWVEYYINLGFDKIILYDNNNINGEIPNIVIQDYIDLGIIDLYTHTKGNTPAEFIKYQASIYTECLEKYKETLDWICFLDIDEFLFIEKYKKIQYLFNAMQEYNEFDNIIMSWNILGNKNELYYKNEPVQKRFTEQMNGIYGPSGVQLNTVVKSFVKTSSNAKFITGPHLTNSNNICNVYGVKCDINDKLIALCCPNHYVMYVNHYYTKSLAEFLYRSKTSFYERTVDIYKNINGWSDEHEKVYQNFLKSNQ